MGKVIPWECITNVLHDNDHTRTLSSSDWEWVQMWEEWKLMMDHLVVVSAAKVELVQEDEEEE